MLRFPSVLVVLFLASLVFAADSGAAVVRRQAVTVTGLTDSVNAKSVTASCSGGRKLTGAAAGKTFAADGQARLLALRPNAALTSVTSTFREDETGFSGNWEVTTYAICGTPLTGLERVAATSASNSTNKNITATCPSGKRVVGVGGETANGAGQVVLDLMRPDSGLASATVGASEDQTGFAGNWTVTAYAICAVPPQGLQRVTASRAKADVFTDVGAACPDNKALLGVGAAISPQSGQVSLETFLTPGSQDTSSFVRAWQDEDGVPTNFSITGFAICANVAIRSVSEGSRSVKDSTGHAFACNTPRSLVATGVGAEIIGGFGQVSFETLEQTTELEGDHVDAHVDGTGFSGAWSITAYGICTTPIPGLVRVTNDSPVNSDEFKFAQVSCPSGTKLVGAGGDVSDGLGHVFMESVAPAANLSGAAVAAHEDENGFGGNWHVTAIAVCATPPPGLQLVSATTPQDSDEIQRATASCPAGKFLLGTGAEILGGGGQALLDDVRPDDALSSITVTSLEDETGADFDRATAAYGICANI